MKKTKRFTVKRTPKRGHYDSETIHQILDNNHICHVALVYEGAPLVIPTLYWRKNDLLFIHGASISRLMTSLEQEMDLSISIAKTTGLVLARSAFHHSLNYESVVLFGKGKLVADTDKEEALKAVSDHLIPDRWEEVRKPSPKELKATTVIAITLDEVTAKVRTGDPKDDKKDYDLPVWAGVVPIKEQYESPIADTLLNPNITSPSPSILKLIQPHKNLHL